MAETTEQYRARMNQLKTSIENEPLIKEMRSDIAEGISKTGNRQADIEVRQNTLEDDFVAVQQDASAVNPSGAEVAVARGSYSTLDQRLTKKEQEVTAQFAQTNKISQQTDFVELVKDKQSPYNNMSVLKRADDAYQIWLSNDDKGIIYDFQKDTNDDFIKLTTGYSGLDKEGSIFVSKDVVDSSKVTGTFTTSGLLMYTTVIGDKATLSVTGGTKLSLHIQCESRGGLWSVSVDGGSPVTVSCYNPTTISKDVIIGSGLIDKAHTVVCTFVGNDPANPPSSSPSRGYLRAQTDLEKGTLTSYSGSVVNTTENTMLGVASNKEFAFIVTKGGFNNWIPEHATVGSAFKVSEPEFFIDGTIFDAVGMLKGSVNAKSIGASFEIKQHIKGHVVGFGEVMEMWLSHNVGIDGKVTFVGKMKALTDFTVTGYPMMLPTQSDFMDEFVSGIYNSKLNDKSESYSYFGEEKDGVKSGAIISTTNPNLIVAGTLTEPIKAYRMGKDGKPLYGQDLFLWNRANQPKMYWQSMNDHKMKLGEIYAWGSEMLIAEIDEIYSEITQ